ncbi:trypsin-like serine peptidase [Archangium violaceum]|uniref:Protease n=1 Tax=Archangium violaceum Cb vi76 TaxID=1406225 RepID=A0A084SSF0_9BACT|nr:serine protease [Archangium violaceum]KFA91385.1 protease [Archangium violaceum Cb vi76]
MARRPPDPFMNPWGLRLAGTVLLGLTACGRPVPVDPPLVCGNEKQPEVSRLAVRGLDVGSLSQCGPTADFTPVNSYQGEFADVLDREEAVALIDGRCTGTLIEASAGPVVITAGHCVGIGDRPLLVFNFEDNPDGEQLVTEGTVIEQSLDPDYALIQLDVLPAVTPVPLTAQATERLAIIQHPRGKPKAIAEGRYLDACARQVYYVDLDTLVGSSGAGIFTRQGYLLGIHTDGDCDEKGGGANRGWTAEAIAEASEYLHSTDIAER